MGGDGPVTRVIPIVESVDWGREGNSKALFGPAAIRYSHFRSKLDRDHVSRRVEMADSFLRWRMFLSANRWPLRRNMR
jgi:hypothetical protein